jgi:hypothetical protein
MEKLSYQRRALQMEASFLQLPQQLANKKATNTPLAKTSLAKTL